VVAELAVQRGGDVLVFGEQQQARGLHVQPVHVVHFLLLRWRTGSSATSRGTTASACNVLGGQVGRHVRGAEQVVRDAAQADAVHLVVPSHHLPEGLVLQGLVLHLYNSCQVRFKFVFLSWYVVVLGQQLCEYAAQSVAVV
jgi:hypothetical protein